ncbi:hypothetical protein P3W70_07060 [Achromobacter denitrificans]|uniref:hypothetical protein n=1 Tax=Achromobacter denitrificans TaxID=32002 RepID=UPI0023E7BBE9|nr:hypothetical protein [Achromobacter denitrificans]MDF3858098.1 hypothetical protein [Achromobacter denitrificans]
MQLARSSETPAPVPLAWAARLIERMQALYGAKFALQWEGIAPARLAEVWAQEIADYSAEEIQRGLASCRGRTFPPTIPEFLGLCRPTLNPEAAYHEAVAGVSARASGAMGSWSHPGVYWAAVRIGQHDLLNMGWQAVRGRWEYALRDVMEQGRWEPIPAPTIALVAPGQNVSTRDEAQKFLREIKKRTGHGIFAQVTDHRAWAQRLIDRAKKGEPIPPTVLQMAQNAVAAPSEANEA